MEDDRQLLDEATKAEIAKIPWLLPAGIPLHRAVSVKRMQTPGYRMSFDDNKVTPPSYLWRVKLNNGSVRIVHETKAYYNKYIPPF